MFLTNVKKLIIKETFIRVYTLLSITVKDSLRQYKLIKSPTLDIYIMKKQQQVKEVAYLGKRIYFGNKPYTLVENEIKGMCQGCDLYDCYCPSRITSLCTQGFILKKDKKE